MSIAIAMSGGVDSSTAAVLLAESKPASASGSSPEIVGLTMQLWNQRRLPQLLGDEAGEGGRATGRCCSLDDVYDARAVASFLKIPYYVINLEKQFEEAVVRPFVEGYLAGETPIPCSLCNTEIKFAQFLTTARQIGAERIATGHYARIRRDEKTGRYQLLRGVDRTKDQAYFLFGLTQEQLAHTEFPLGEMTKQEVRAIAKSRGLPVAAKPDSQEICFVPTGSYRQFIDAYLAEQQRQPQTAAGEVVSTDGNVLGEHQGIQNFTVGQRKGLGMAVGEPLYVISLDPAKNRVVVGEDRDLFRSRFEVRDVNWIRPISDGETVDAHVKIRHNHQGAAARLEALGDFTAFVEFKEPQRAITPGQAAVFYDGDEVVGGGWISKVV